MHVGGHANIPLALHSPFEGYANNSLASQGSHTEVMLQHTEFDVRAKFLLITHALLE